jgi:RiboL-PSP-HEPN
MPSRSRRTWKADARRALDELEAVHRSVGGSGRGRRLALQQINQAYVVLLASWFQAYCRDLHTECIDHLIQFVQPVGAKGFLRRRLMDGRKLDSGNPNPGNLGSDFGRLGVELWSEIQVHDSSAKARQDTLDALNRWRNAIAHQDFSHPFLVGTNRVQLTEIRRWRRVCNALAMDFERVMYDHLVTVTGTRPW